MGHSSKRPRRISLRNPYDPANNPAVRRLVEGRLHSAENPECAKSFEEYRKLLETPAERAKKALHDLLCQAKGQECRDMYTAAAEGGSTKGSDSPSAAAQNYVDIICKHVQLLNSLAREHPALLLPISRKRISWPVMKSPHPHLSEDESPILNVLEVGRDSGVYFDKYSKWKPSGKIAALVDEILANVNSVRHVSALKGTATGEWLATFVWHLPFNLDVFYAPLRNRSIEKAAEKLPPLNVASHVQWDRLIVQMLERCFSDPTCAEVLACFVTAPSKGRSLGRAKQHLIRRVRARLKALAGIKVT